MDRETLEKIKPLMEYGDIKAAGQYEYTLAKTGIEKLVNAYLKAIQVQAKVKVNFADKVYIVFKQLLGSSGATIVGVYTDANKARGEKHLQSTHSKAYNFTIIESKISA